MTSRTATTARRDGDAWVLDGEKTYISNGGIADVYVVFARTGEGSQGISCFLVPGDLDFIPGPGPRTLDLPGFGAVGVQICYEIVFSGETIDRAASYAWTSIAAPMLTGTLVTVAGFIPIGLNSSAAGEFTFSLFVVIAVSLVISWIVAVLFAPLLHASWQHLLSNLVPLLIFGLLLFVGGFAISTHLQVGDLDSGAPELKTNSRYNRDNAFINQHYNLSSDVFAVIVKTPAGGVESFPTLTEMDRLEAKLRETEGVRGTVSAASDTGTVTSGVLGAMVAVVGVGYILLGSKAYTGDARWRSSLAALTLVVVAMLLFLSLGMNFFAFPLLAGIIGLFGSLLAYRPPAETWYTGKEPEPKTPRSRK